MCENFFHGRFFIEFSVNFNADVSGKLNFADDQVNTSTKLSRLMCDPKRMEPEKILTELGYQEFTQEFLDEKSHIN